VTSADLLLHPVRLRIVQAFLGERPLTTAQLRAELPDIPPASLYRHIALLADADVLQVVSERRVRGATERTYMLRLAAATIDPREIEKMGTEDYRRTFQAFVAGLLADFDRYLEKGDVDPLRDGVTFNLAGMWLSDEELVELSRELAVLFGPRLANAPREGRRRRLLATVLLPGD
jgi:hypothetical protein